MGGGMFFKLLFERFIIFMLGRVRRKWGIGNCFFFDFFLSLFLFNWIVFKFVKKVVIDLGSEVRLLFVVISVFSE